MDRETLDVATSRKNVKRHEVLVVLHLLLEGASAEGREENDEVKILDFTSSLIDSLTKSTEFFHDNYDKQNVDALYCLRVVQGVALHLIERLSNPEQPGLLTSLQKLNEKVENAASMVYKYLEQSKSKYVEQFNKVIQKPWFFSMSEHDIRHSLINVQPSDHRFKERFSDFCFGKLIQSKSSNDECDIPEKCWRAMTRRGLKNYSLTHQALYFIFGILYGCKDQFIQRIGSRKNFLDFLDYFRANIYNQINQEYIASSSEDINKDLFSEQAVICEMLGVKKCHDRKILQLIMKWQDKESGCWKDGNSKEKREDLAENSWFEDVIAGDFTTARFVSRKLLKDNVLSDGCSTHFTGISTAALAMGLYHNVIRLQRNARQDYDPGFS